jgi:hypothetical protein
MSVISAVPEQLLAYAAATLPYEDAVIRASEDLEEKLQAFQSRCPEYRFCPTPRGQEVARHALRGQTLAEWTSAVGAAFSAVDRGFVSYLPGAVRTISDADLAAYLESVGAFALLEQREAFAAGIDHAMRIEQAIAARDAEAAEALLRQLADYGDNDVFLRAVFLSLGDLDDLEDRIDAFRDRGNVFGRFFGGAWDATAGTVTTLWGLTGQAIYDADGAGRNWSALGDALAYGWDNPGDFALTLVDWEGLKDDPVRWLGGLAPDAVLAVATAGTGAVASRGASATRAAVRGLRSAENLTDVMRALRPLAGAVLTDVESGVRTIGGRQVHWTPVGYADEAGNVSRVFVGARRGPLSRLEDVVGHDPTTTFRSGQYLVRTTDAPTTLYRVGARGRPLGSYWTAVRPKGPGQAQMDHALRPDWGNTAQEVTEIRLPAGQTIYEGVAGPQPLRPGGSAAPTSSGLLGGGHQVFVPNVPADWIIESRPFLAAAP